MNVRTAGFHADFAQDLDRTAAHPLIFLVGERQCRGDRNRVARVDPHGIDVLNRADDDGIVGAIANDLHFEFLPTEKALVDEDLASRRGLQPDPAESFEVVPVEGNAAAGSAQCECRTNDRRQPDLVHRCDCFIQCVRYCGIGADQTDAVHRIPEQLAVLGLPDRFPAGTDQLHPEPVEHTGFGHLQRGVERRLPTHGRQQCLRTFALDYPGHGVGRDRLDIGCVRHRWVGHDRCGVRIDQDDPVTLLPQRLARLGAGIVEFAGLTYDDRSCTDNHDRGNVGALGHAEIPENAAGYRGGKG